MIRRRTCTLSMIEPPTPAERKAIARWEMLSALPAPSDAEREEAERTASGLTTTETRWALASLNTLQYGRYEANRRLVIAWIEVHTGKPWAEALKTPEADDLIDAGLRWARIAAAVTAVDQRTVNRVTDAAGEWEAVQAAGLDSIDAFLDAYSGDLALALENMVFDLNPGLFGAKLDSDDAKKNGGTSAS